MTEQTLQIVQALKIVYLAGFSFLYGWGGMVDKVYRRIVGAIYMTIGIVGFSIWQDNFSWWYLSYALLLWSALSVGYGATTTKRKILKRSRYGLLLALASLPIAIVTGQWTLLCLHIFLCITISTVLGVINPISARGEETLIGTIGGLLPLYYLG